MIVSYYNGNRCKLDVHDEHFSLIREHFSYDDPAARFANRDGIPRRKYSITKVGYMDIGLLWDVIKVSKENKWDIKFKVSPLVKSRMMNTLNIPILNVPNEQMKHRYYQKDSIISGFKVGNGIIVVGTGGGKSLILASMMESIHSIDPNCKMMLVVPDVGLVNQMYADFEEYECSFTYSKWMGGCDLDDSSNLVIVHTKYLQTFSKEKIKQYDSLFKSIDYLFHDEVHLFHSNSGSIPKSTKLLTSYDYEHKFGLTGSMHKESYTRDKIVGFFGATIYEKNSKELREEKYLSDVEVNMIKFNHIDPMGLYKFDKNTHATEDYNLEIDHVLNSEFRNNGIEKIVNNLKGNVLILVERIAQGEVMFDRLSRNSNKTVYFISGATKGVERQRIIAEMEKNDDIICIAMSKIFSTGVSVKNIPFIIFAYLGKAWHKTVQAVGRGLRLHENKDKLRLFDLYDNLMYSSKHADERKKIYHDQDIKFKEFKVNE